MPGSSGQPVKPLILLVEDERPLRKVMEILFESEGYQVVPARNGLEALELLAGIMPDLIVSDYMMPELDGAGFLRALRADERLCHVPVLLMSSAHPEDLPGHDLADKLFLKGGELPVLLSLVASLVSSGAAGQASD